MTTHDEHSADGTANGALSAYATLLRVPNLFTAPPDVLLGASLVAGLGHAVAPEAVAGVALASMLLYGGGTTLNDYADREEDARDRPERPIPSGAVAPSRALALGALLLLAGVAVAAAAAGVTAGAAAALVAALIACYDGVLKGSSAGFLCMGATRGANVLLGTAVAVPPTQLPALEASVPIVVALYVAAVTFFAEFETGGDGHRAVLLGDGRRAILVGVIAAGIAAAWTLLLAALRAPSDLDRLAAVVLVAGFLAWTGQPLRRAYREPAPETIGPAVGACVLGLVLLDAALAATTGLGWALATAAFLLPAVGLSKAFDVS